MGDRYGIELCGTLAVTFDGQELSGELPGRQGRLLFAYLAARYPEPATREELVGVLWPPDGAPRSARDALNVVVSKLKRAVGPGVLAGRDPLWLELPPGVTIDLHEAARLVTTAEAALGAGQPAQALEAARAALDIAEHELLPGQHAGWLDERRRELEELRLRALESAAQAGAALGGETAASAERWARALIAAAPFRESGHRLLMELLVARGNAAEALRIYEELRVRLREELGTVPALPLQALHARLLALEDAPVTAAVAVPAGPGPAVDMAPPTVAAIPEAPTPAEPPATAPVVGHAIGDATPPLPALLARAAGDDFVGRERPLGTLLAHWADAAGDARPGCRLVAIAGEPGVGKTALAAQFAAGRHLTGATVLYGRCDEEALAPYQPFTEALAPLAASAPMAAVPVPLRAELERILPGSAFGVAPAAPHETERYRLFTAVEELLAATARRAPLLVVLDDLHWADRPTLALLRHLARSGAQAPMLLLGTFRDVEVGAGDPLRQLLGDLRREGVADRIDLPGLSLKEIGELVELVLDAPPRPGTIERLRASTEGNPLFLRELLRVAREDPEGHLGIVPEGVRELIEQRLARVAGPVARALQAGAVAGRTFDLRVLEACEELAESDVLEALEEAAGARLVSEVPGRPGCFQFSHALVRDALYASLSAARRARLHQQVAGALEQGVGPPADPAEIAHHLLQAGDRVEPERVVAALRRAAERASAQAAHEEAAEHFEGALAAADAAGLAEPERCDLMLAAGGARSRAGEVDEGRALFARAAELARGSDPQRLAIAALGLHGRYSDSGVVDDQAIELLSEALEACGEEQMALRVTVQARLAQALYWTGQADRVEQLSREAVERAEAGLEDPRVLAVALEIRHDVLRVPWHLDERRELVDRFLARALELGDRELAAQAHQLRAVDTLEAGEVSEHERSVVAVRRLAAELRQPFLERYATFWAQVRAQVDGRLDEAERIAHEGLALSARAGTRDGAQAFGAQLFGVLRYRGGLEQMLPMAEAIVEQYPELRVWRAGLALICAESGDHERAQAELDILATDDFGVIAPDLFWMLAISLCADACAVIGDTGHARVLHSHLAPYAAHMVMARGAACMGPAARSVAALAALLGNHAEAEKRFTEAVILARRLRSPLYEAHARLDQGAARLALGGEAEPMLRAALMVAQRLGAQQLALRAEALLASAPAVPHP